MKLVMSGLDYSLAPIALRERLSFTKAAVEDLDRAVARMPGVAGCVLLSTCNRTEIYLSPQGEAELNPGEALCAAAGVDYAPFAHAFRTRHGEEAARHLMEVACGLKSQIWGEDQILTQVKTAAALAREAGSTDGVLETLFRTAASAGKEVKTSVRLTSLPASAAHRAVERLGTLAGGLTGRRALVIGNGEMGRLAASLLREAGCAVTVTLRSYHHGETVVPAGCAVAHYDDRYQAMEGADLLISATTSPHYTVGEAEYRQAARPPRLLADLAIPRDIQPQVGELPGVTLLNVDALGVAPGDGTDPAALLKAQGILDGHLERLRQWYSYRDSLPALEDVKEAIVERVLTAPALAHGPDPEELVELAVGRAVELLAAGLKDGLDADALRQCARKIRDNTTGRRVLPLKEERDGAELPALSTVC